VPLGRIQLAQCLEIAFVRMHQFPLPAPTRRRLVTGDGAPGQWQSVIAGASHGTLARCQPISMGRTSSRHVGDEPERAVSLQR
jgi:hypothetical protein